MSSSLYSAVHIIYKMIKNIENKVSVIMFHGWDKSE